MPAINADQYKIIADLYADAQGQVTDISDYYYAASYEILILNTFEPELDLLSPFHNAYLSSLTLYAQAPQSIISAVNSLQRHVLNHARTNDGSRFSNINQWIDAAGTNSVSFSNVGRQGDDDTSFKVKPAFAQMSAQAGFEIHSDNIES